MSEGINGFDSGEIYVFHSVTVVHDCADLEDVRTNVEGITVYGVKRTGALTMTLVDGRLYGRCMTCGEEYECSMGELKAALDSCLGD